jgi:hypothetical protein
MSHEGVHPNRSAEFKRTLIDEIMWPARPHRRRVHCPSEGTSSYV